MNAVSFGNHRGLRIRGASFRCIPLVRFRRRYGIKQKDPLPRFKTGQGIPFIWTRPYISLRHSELPQQQSE
jgi:hypothetical protein